MTGEYGKRGVSINNIYGAGDCVASRDVVLEGERAVNSAADPALTELDVLMFRVNTVDFFLDTVPDVVGEVAGFDDVVSVLDVYGDVEVLRSRWLIGRNRGVVEFLSSPASRSIAPSPVIVVSYPFAVPLRAPAEGIMSIGAALRCSYPDLTRLLLVSSLQKQKKKRGQRKVSDMY